MAKIRTKEATGYNGVPDHLPARTLLIGSISLGLILFLRLIALDSDAYARLSWSSALLTDEGFYLHNARNLVLFGQTRTDAFNNQLIMPLLHLLQVLLFRSVGVGLVQARLLSVGCSLLTLGLMYGGLRRAFGVRVACCGTLLLGLDHTNLLYNRLALMDTPAALFGVGAFWAFAHPLTAAEAGDGNREGRWWLVVCGALLGLGYTVRGLVALIWIVPLALLVWESRQRPALKAVGVGQRRFSSLFWLGLGLAGVMGVYVLVWWWPHRQELQFVNHYYIKEQLIPHSLHQLISNIRTALFSWNRGVLPYLIKHTPVQVLMAGLWIGGAIKPWFRKSRSIKPANPNISTSDMSARNFASAFLIGWLLIFLAFLAVVNYAPSRYNVLFYPALAGLAALEIDRLLDSSRAQRNLASALMVGWCFINACWLGDWLSHLTYRQRDTDLWLGRHLPQNAVVLGAVAPGLCIDNHLRAVNVIQDLCNDHKPVEAFAPAPRYILILDDRWKEVWWVKHYPELVAPHRRAYAFRHMLRPFFTIGLYPVPPATLETSKTPAPLSSQSKTASANDLNR